MPPPMALRRRSSLLRMSGGVLVLLERCGSSTTAGRSGMVVCGGGGGGGGGGVSCGWLVAGLWLAWDGMGLVSFGVFDFPGALVEGRGGEGRGGWKENTSRRLTPETATFQRHGAAGAPKSVPGITLRGRFIHCAPSAGRRATTRPRLRTRTPPTLVPSRDVSRPRFRSVCRRRTSSPPLSICTTSHMSPPTPPPPLSRRDESRSRSRSRRRRCGPPGAPRR